MQFNDEELINLSCLGTKKGDIAVSRVRKHEWLHSNT